MKKVFRQLGSLDDIISIQGCSFGGYVEIVTNSKNFVIGGCIAQVAAFIDNRFIRINRHIVVHRSCIVQPIENKSVSLTDGRVLAIPRRKRNEVFASILSC